MENPIVVFLAVILMISVLIDLRTHKIPNRLTYPTIVLAIAFHLYTGGTAGLIFSVKGLGLGLSVFFIPYLMGGMGAGDAKLMGAVGAVLGAEGVFFAMLYSAIIGGIYAMGLMVIRGSRLDGFSRRQWQGLKYIILTQKLVPDAGDEKMPKLCYGVAIALGTFVYLGLEISQLGQIV